MGCSPSKPSAVADNGQQRLNPAGANQSSGADRTARGRQVGQGKKRSDENVVVDDVDPVDENYVVPVMLIITMLIACSLIAS